MIARIRKSLREKDQGFTLIELLVVMIIIGILAAVAIPIFLNQRKKANDSAATSDVSTLGKEVATYYVDASAVLPDTTGVAIAAGRYTVNSVDVGKVSGNITAVALKTTDTSSTQAASTSWCVQLTYTGGTASTVKYSAQDGLVKGGTC